MHTFLIAPASPEDCEDCAQLLVGQLAEHSIAVAAEPLAQLLRGLVADPTRGFLLVARVDGRIVGVAYVATMVSVEHCGPVAWLEEIYVAPAFRSRGIGTALLSAALERAGGEGIVAVDLEIDAGHRRAMSLYQRFGFHRLDRSRWVKVLKA